MSSHLFSIGAVNVIDRYGCRALISRVQRLGPALAELGHAQLTIQPFSDFGKAKVAVTLGGYDSKHVELAAQILADLRRNSTADYDFGRPSGELPTRRSMEAPAKSIVIAGRVLGNEKW